MNRFHLIFSLLAMVLVLGCEKSEHLENKKPAGVITKHQLEVLENVQGVEQVLLQTDQDRKEKI